MTASRRALPVPDEVARDASAVELVRVWASGRRQHVSLMADAWADPAAWGIMLVDLARHVSRAIATVQHTDPDQTLGRIRAGFDAEWSHHTDKPIGDVRQ
ncbi:MAG: DUF5076 domain-containing protein [Phycisphaerae bacterium]|nr:DUF5076 domain-containing protein [Phycisphaerae bacterium]